MQLTYATLDHSICLQY